jgi:hypothetical protein
MEYSCIDLVARCVSVTVAAENGRDKDSYKFGHLLPSHEMNF